MQASEGHRNFRCVPQNESVTTTTVFHLQTECNREYSVYLLVKFIATSERMDPVKRHFSNGHPETQTMQTADCRLQTADRADCADRADRAD